MFKFSEDNCDSDTGNDAAPAPGKIHFDERGNAVYAWGDARLEGAGKQGEKLRERALQNHTLSLIDDSSDMDNTRIRNDKGLRVGYNPYQSGQLEGAKPSQKKPSLRELSKWIEQQRRLGLVRSAIKK